EFWLLISAYVSSVTFAIFGCPQRPNSGGDCCAFASTAERASRSQCAEPRAESPGSDRGPQVGRDGREGDEDRRPQRGPHGPGSTDVLRVALRRTAGGGPEPQGGGGPRSAKGAAFHRRCPDHLLPARGTRAA